MSKCACFVAVFLTITAGLATAETVTVEGPGPGGLLKGWAG